MKHQYQVGIIGGGVAGLTSAIQLAKKGHSVVLFEKNFYPFHRVCGEYISNESLNFLNEIGFAVDAHELPKIKNFQLSNATGADLELKLPLGGFGVSRHYLDDKLADLALANGVILLQGTEVTDVHFIEEHDLFQVFVTSGDFTCKTILGSFGKKSKLDKKKSRAFTHLSKNDDNNFVGIKYHVNSPIEDDRIELHLFDQGYAGISKVEENKTCFCYLTTAGQLKKYDGDIQRLENEVLRKNPFIELHFQAFEKLWKEPVTISNIEFGPKELVHDHMLMLGDAAGMITPLTGNGMSMAMHASKMASKLTSDFLTNKITRDQMEQLFVKEWSHHFAKRVKRARKYQSLFFNQRLVNNVITFLKPFPFIIKRIISSTHGKGF